jgi:Outer membrane protein beta-barrel domain
MRKRAGFAAALLVLTSMSMAQDHRFDVGVGGAAVLSKQSSGNNTVLTPTKSGAYLVTGRYRFTARSSIELNYVHTSNSQIYSAPPLIYRINNTIGEYSGAYVFSFLQTDKLEPFVFAGAAALVFYPAYSSNTVNGVQTYLPAVRQTQPALLYGVGVDYPLLSRVPFIRRFFVAEKLTFRLQYRGLVYKAPDFSVPNLFTAARGHMAEPSVGIVVKF